MSFSLAADPPPPVSERNGAPRGRWSRTPRRCHRRQPRTALLLGLAATLTIVADAAAVSATPPASGTRALELYDLSPDGYPLDHIERVIAPTGPVRCPKVELVRYRGVAIPLHAPASVAAPLVPHLHAFEVLVTRVALRHFGRAPSKIRHMGTLNCRRTRTVPTFLSEHGLANGIDIAEFYFPRAAKDVAAKLPKSLRGAFSVSVGRHWRNKAASARLQRAFMHDLGREVVAATHIFRVVLGPGYPGHEDHLHVDCAPYRLVQIDLDPVGP